MSQMDLFGKEQVTRRYLIHTISERNIVVDAVDRDGAISALYKRPGSPGRILTIREIKK